MIDAATVPRLARAEIRAGRWTGVTTGLCAGYLQANLAIVAAASAAEFAGFCRANPAPLPVLEVTEAGVADRLRTAPGADLRTDLPGYRVYRNGVLDEEVPSIERVWREDSVGFLLGCSFSAEEELRRAGVRLRHLELGTGVPMYRTSVPCVPVGRFHGPVVVSMRAVAEGQVAAATEVTARLPLAHGAPLHVGDPSVIGIADLAEPDWGDPLPLEPGEVAMFWACGVTPQAVFAQVRPELAITHAPGHMFLTDLRVEPS